MTDTDAEVTEAETEDPTPPALWNYGLSGEPLRMAPTPWQSAVEAMRQANLGVLDVAAVQPILDASFPDAGYQAADLCLTSPPTGTFQFSVGDEDVVTFTADDDELPDANIQWDFGDRTTEHGRVVEHTYAEPGTYTAQVSVAVAGSIFQSTQDVEVGEPPAAEPKPADEPEQMPGADTQLAPGAGLPESKPGKRFTADDEPEAEEEFDPGDYTVDAVVEYVDENPDELDRLIGMEEVGKARVTLLEKLYARQAE